MTEPQEQAKSSVFTLSEEQIREHYNVKDYTERVYKEIRQPHGVASNADFYRQENGVRVPNITFLRLHLYHEGRLTEDQVIFLLRRVTEIFTQESNVLRLSAPITSGYRGFSIVETIA
ncbi:3',5'-cyclic-nucleotide phosphodiesterase (PDEase) (3':5'-CNP) [Serendipita sp. 397]|nr:3',5'-cyclic-nucleotide phosphodiesterase (PDEase) (3':5'-CNP) [Serendipita sp. 397]